MAAMRPAPLEQGWDRCNPPRPHEKGTIVLTYVLGIATFVSGSAVLVNSGAHFNSARPVTVYLQVPLGIALMVGSVTLVLLTH
jgi:hypothetical protein